MVGLPPGTTKAMAKSMDAATCDPNKIPGVVFAAVNKKGETLFAHASGKRGIDTPERMTLESVFWIASCTKMIAGIAAMQLVERGILDLDSADQIDHLAPELSHIQILQGFDEATGRAIMVPKKNCITMRMLLTHTAGFEYTFSNEKVRLYGQPAGIDEIDANFSGILSHPLLYEPGTDWSYGVGIDWAGEIIVRLTRTPLNTYFQTHIFAPLGLHQITMLPTPQMIAQLAHMHQRTPSGQLRARDHPFRKPLITPPSEQNTIFHSAGAGGFARPMDYVQIIATLLNNGVCTRTGQRILSENSVEEMFTNQIPQLTDFGRKGVESAKPTYTTSVAEFYPQVYEGKEGEEEGKNKPQGWGLTFMLNLHEHPPTGRGKGTGWWAGLSNLFWWADREKGVGGMIASQILPFADLEVITLRDKLEKMVYDGL